LFPSDVVDIRHKILDQLTRKVDAKGAVRDPCQSRILESVLALKLLECSSVEPGRCASLRQYLVRQADSAKGPERSLVTAVLAEKAREKTASLLVSATRVPDFTVTRKRALLDALTVLVDDCFVPGWDESAFDLSGLHSWAVAQVTAVKVILADAAGHPERVTDEDVRLLLETQQTSHVWEGNILIHLWVLHALARLPNTRSVVTAGLHKVLAHQRADGGLPFVSDTDIWCTATAGVALAAAGAPRELLHRIAGYLARRQQPGGGWSYTDLACQTDVDDTSVAVQFLHLFDAEKYHEHIDRGIRSLYAVIGPDGGFPTYLSGAPSEASMTAAALDAFTTQRARHEPVLINGLRYLAAQQRADGSFPPDWSSSRLHTVFRAVLAATRHPAPSVQHMVHRSMTLVRTQQNSDGGWGQQGGDPSDIISTAYGLIAMCGQADPKPAADAAAFLTAAWQADSGVHVLPDSIGPRGFVFTVPALAEIFTLLALGHLDHRLTAAAMPDELRVHEHQ
jgi:hypothetical protein